MSAHSGPSRHENVVARLLVLICVLNLNGVVTMLTGVGQTFSIFLLVGALYLLTRGIKTALAGPIIWLIIAVAAYLILANLYYDPSSSSVDPFQINSAYLSSLLLIVAVASYCGRLIDERHRRGFVEFLRNTFVIAAAATLLSPVLYQFYTYLPQSSTQRMGGLFGNPNEAAVVAVFAAALLQTFPFRNRLTQLALLLLVIVSVILTLSKTGMVAMIVVLFVTSIWPIKLPKLLIISALAVAAFAFVQDPRALILATVETLGLNLNDSQLTRLLAVPEILSGRLDEETTTHRSLLWQAIYEDAWRRFPTGGGIGSAHNYSGVGGLYQNNTWQGAHNVFLMLFAEAGPLAPMLMVVALVSVAAKLWSLGSTARPLLLLLMVLVVELSSTHTGLTTRYSNIVIASIFGLAHAIWKMQRRQRFAAIMLAKAANGAPSTSSVSIQPTRERF